MTLPWVAIARAMAPDEVIGLSEILKSLPEFAAEMTMPEFKP